MNKLIALFSIVLIISCKDSKSVISAQEIVNNSIQVSGGEKYTKSNIAFDFRDIHYTSEINGSKEVLSRVVTEDSIVIKDVKTPTGFQRFVNNSLVQLADTTANKYANSVNSVHYFSKLPYGLNDRAVNKKFLGKTMINNQEYYKVEVTFHQEGGGDDFDDIYVYWFNSKTWKPDYLAYEFHVNGGGQRFREAFNERYVGGLRFVDYNNYKPLDNGSSIYNIDALFEKKELQLLSKIELENIKVNPGNYN